MNNAFAKKDLRSQTLAEIEKFCKLHNLPSFRAKQIFGWLKTAETFDEMTNIPLKIRTSLSEEYFLSLCKVEKKLVSKLDGTVKYLFSLYDGELIESVLMQYKHGNTLCISSQAGCRMGCAFCATGLLGLCRNLTSGEMLAQIIKAQQDSGLKISNIVMMGMGEPLDNFENTVRFLELVSSADGLNIGARHISLSTCGVVPKIYKLMALKSQITLSVSLHAPFDDMRIKMMPVAKSFSIKELLDACRKYIEVTSRRISFEYAVIKGVNDSDACAEELARLLKGMLCHINLIPVNKVAESGYNTPEGAAIQRFAAKLLSKGINTTVRRTLGADISASCGQLRGQSQK